VEEAGDFTPGGSWCHTYAIRLQIATTLTMSSTLQPRDKSQ
jgi:hypothetical protein